MGAVNHNSIVYSVYLLPDVDTELIEILENCSNKSALIKKALHKQLVNIVNNDSSNDNSYEWIRTQIDKTHYRYVCSNCKKPNGDHKSDFCPNCGKPMITDRQCRGRIIYDKPTEKKK